MNHELDPITLGRLRGAVRGEIAPLDLAVKIRARLVAPPKPRWLLNWRPLGAVAALVLAVGGFTGYQLGNLRFSNAAEDSYIASISARVPAIMTAGLGDHVHCAVYRNASKTAISAADLSKRMGERFHGLAELVKEQVPPEFRIVESHRCKFNGRVFVHVAMRNDSKLLSLVIASKRDGEGLGDVLQAGVQPYQIAAFETREFLAYVVSDMDREGNTRVTAMLAPAVAAYLDRLRT